MAYLPNKIMVYIWDPNVIINSGPFLLKVVKVWATNYMIKLPKPYLLPSVSRSLSFLFYRDCIHSHSLKWLLFEYNSSIFIFISFPWVPIHNFHWDIKRITHSGKWHKLTGIASNCCPLHTFHPETCHMRIYPAQPLTKERWEMCSRVGK